MADVSFVTERERNAGTARANGAPIILAQSAIPMILPSSGTMGANGALTGLTALPYSAFPQPCFMYFPAGKVFSGSPAGMYYAILTSATAATVYNNRYTSGLPQDAIPGVLTPVVDAGPGAYTQTTGSLISLATITIPGGVMGPNGLFAMDYWTTQSNNANAKVGNTSFDGSGGSTSAPTSTAGNKYEFRIHNRGSVSSQVMSGSSGACSSTGPNMSVYPALNTAADKTVAIQVQMTTVATDYMILESFTATIYPG